MNKFYKFKNLATDNAELYIYGAITDHKDEDWFVNESDVDLDDFKANLDELIQGSTLNIYVNSPGGSVFAASTMCSMLKRAKETKNVKIIAYIDGLAASAASFLIMSADEIKVYSNSMLMVHKPLSFVYGNAEDMKKEIDVLDNIEENIMLPLYESKSKVSIKEIKDLVDKESWLSAKEVDNYFNVTLLNESKDCLAMVDKNIFTHYKNVPDIFKNNCEPKQQKVVEDINQNIDYSYFDEKLKKIGGKK